MQETDNTKKFTDLFCELEDCDEEDQKRKIFDMNTLMEEMDEKEFDSIFTMELFNKMDKMIKEKKLSIENTISLVKHIGCCKVMKSMWGLNLKNTLLCKRFEKMIIKEKKKKVKNENLLVGLCECYLMLFEGISKELISISLPCLLKVALNKEENEETQKEVEIALMALNNIGYNKFIEQKLYLDEIKEIIKYHQKHFNLTRLAYQSAWQFLIKLMIKFETSKVVIANELHLGREAARELEELRKCVDWKREKEEGNGEGEAKEVCIIRRWLCAFFDFFLSCRPCYEGFVELISSIVQMFRASMDRNGTICNWSISLLRGAAKRGAVKIDYLLKGGAVDAALEGMQRPTLDDRMLFESLKFLANVINRLKEKTDNEIEVNRKVTKRKIFEKIEEEGCEDIITSFHEALEFFKRNYDHSLSLNISDYLVNV